MEPKIDQARAGDIVPRIVNGMPYRPRKVSLWEGLGFAGLLLVPDVLLLLAAIPLAMRGILKYFDSKGWLPNRSDTSERSSAEFPLRVNRVGLALCQPLPVYPKLRTCRCIASGEAMGQKQTFCRGFLRWPTTS